MLRHETERLSFSQTADRNLVHTFLHQWRTDANVSSMEALARNEVSACICYCSLGSPEE